jgi:hypothetical protein
MLIEYFKRITEKFPTEAGKRHCIVYDSEMECLKIGVWLEDQMMTFCIETEDEFNDLDQLISDIENLMRPWTHAAMPNAELTGRGPKDLK